MALASATEQLAAFRQAVTLHFCVQADVESTIFGYWTSQPQRVDYAIPKLASNLDLVTDILTQSQTSQRAASEITRMVYVSEHFTNYVQD